MVQMYACHKTLTEDEKGWAQENNCKEDDDYITARTETSGTTATKGVGCRRWRRRGRWHGRSTSGSDMAGGLILQRHYKIKHLRKRDYLLHSMQQRKRLPVSSLPSKNFRNRRRKSIESIYLNLERSCYPKMWRYKLEETEAASSIAMKKLSKKQKIIQEQEKLIKRKGE